jgi:hypothetical protein
MTVATAVAHQSVSPSPPSSVSLTEQAYDQVLDRIFPRELFAGRNLAYTMILRFTPSFAAESQLVIRVGLDKSVEARLYAVERRSAADTAEEYVKRTGQQDIVKIAAAIEVTERRLQVDFQEVERWHSQLYDALDSSVRELKRSAAEYLKSGTVDVVLDGTTYDLWYAQGTLESHWRYVDVDANGREVVVPLTRWLNMVRSAAQKRPAAQ